MKGNGKIIHFSQFNVFSSRFVPSQADTAVFEALTGAPKSDTPHALRWYNDVKSFGAGMKQFDGLLGACDEDDSKCKFTIVRIL